MKEATKRPWKTGTTGDGDLWIEGTDPREPVIADIVPRKQHGITEEDEANAELIVRAVNSFDALLSALKEVLRTGLNGGDNIRLAYIAAGQKALTPELHAKAEESERAVIKARAAISLAEKENHK